MGSSKNVGKNAGITVQVPNQIGLYSAFPVLKEIQRRGVSLYISARQDVLEKAHQSDLKFDSLPLEPIERASSLRERLHSALMLAATDWDFSNSYRMRMEQLSEDAGNSRTLLLKLLDQIPGASGPSVNSLAARLPNLANRFESPTERLLVVSPAPMPHLLCHTPYRIDTLMESWDHPSKKPAGYRGSRVIAWNHSVYRDWVKFQGPTEEVAGYPYKLRYFLERPVRPNVSSAGKIRRIMYAATSSRMTPYRSIFEEERQLISQIALECFERGIELLVKPKPASRLGEFDDLANRHSNVFVGDYGSSTGPTGFSLSDEYNSARYRELESVDAVLCFGTTFALDAAIAGVPVVQLDLRGSSVFPDCGFASGNHHLVRHFFCYDNFIVSPDESTVAQEAVEAVFSPKPSEYSQALRDWIQPEVNCKAATARIVDALLDPV